MIKHIIFDLDGTLIDSSPSVLAGFEHVFLMEGLEPLIPLKSSVIGPPLIQTLRVLSGIEDKKKLLQMARKFMEYYDFEACLSSQPYKGVDVGLRKLVQDNFKLHIATNKRYIPAKNILKHLVWDSLFTSLYTLDKDGISFKSKSEMIKSQLRKFDLSADQTFYVGDRMEDMEAALNNQLKFIGVSWGYGKFSEHVPTIDFFKQLENFVV